VASTDDEIAAHDRWPNSEALAGLADEVWDILVAECGASEQGREAYRLEVAERGWPEEWRFVGALGFGGKVRWDRHGERLYVDCYREDETPERKAMIDRANEALKL
jgi:hypothetical protein